MYTSLLRNNRYFPPKLRLGCFPPFSLHIADNVIKNERSAYNTGANRYALPCKLKGITNQNSPQNAFHQNIMQMRETARASVLSLPGNGANSARSTIYSRDGYSDDSQALMQHTPPKSSGLRNYLPDDSAEYEDGEMMRHSEDRKDGRF